MITSPNSGSPKCIKNWTHFVTEVTRRQQITFTRSGLVLPCNPTGQTFLDQYPKWQGNWLSPILQLDGLGFIPPTWFPSSHKVAFIVFVTLLARCIILVKWKSAIPPSQSLWMKDILNHFAQLEKLRCVLRSSLRKFPKVWDPFYDYVRRLNINISEIYRGVFFLQLFYSIRCD